MQAAGATAAARPAVAAVAASRAHAPPPPRRPSAQPRHQHEQQQHIQLGMHRQEQLPRQVAAAAARGAAPARQQQQFVQVDPDGSDAWRLDPIVDALKEGAVGIIPTGEGCRVGQDGKQGQPWCSSSGITARLASALPKRAEASTCAHTSADSNLAFVCDLGNRSAVEKLLTIKRSKDSKRMAILCRNLQVRAWAGLAGKAGRDASQAGGRLAAGRRQSAAHAGCIFGTSEAWRLLLATAMWPLCCQR